MVWLSILLIATQAFCWVVAVMGPNTCSRLESFTVTMRILEKKPITTKTYTWCLKMPPRCTKYKQEMVDHYRIQAEPRTRWVNECCPGFQPDEASMYCEPTCALGCQHGNCTAPNTCSCQPGYNGPSCDTKCSEGRWGRDCQQTCSCLNSTSCHHETGECICSPGYIGNRCESPCPSGMFGDRCGTPCKCEGLNTCHHVTGSCDAVLACNGTSTCQTAWTSSQPEMIQRLLDNAATSHDRPITEPLITSSENINSNNTIISTGNHTHNTPITQLDDINEASEYRIEGTTTIITTLQPSSYRPLHLSTTSTNGLPSESNSEMESNERTFIDEQSHEEQLEHWRNDQTTEPNTQESEIITESSSGTPQRVGMFEITNVSQISGDENLDEFRNNSEINTQNPQNGEETEINESDGKDVDKTDIQRKKSTDQKKHILKERIKDTPNQKLDIQSQTPINLDHDWQIPEFDHEESPKYHEQIQEGSPRDNMERIVDLGKPKRMSDQKRVKDMVDVGQLKITANQERQQGDNHHTYNEFLSSFSIAAGVSTGVIMVAGLITLMARCRRTKPNQEVSQGVEMDTVNSKQEDIRASVVPEETTLPVVRPLFFSPLYLPGDVSPTEGNGLILTAVFSRPASNIHDLYRQQDLLRESLAPHYDVPPPTGTRNSTCTSIGTTEPEHVYEELPYWQNHTTSIHNESHC